MYRADWTTVLVVGTRLNCLPESVAGAGRRPKSDGEYCGESEYTNCLEESAETPELQECIGLGENKGLVDCLGGDGEGLGEDKGLVECLGGEGKGLVDCLIGDGKITIERV